MLGLEGAPRPWLLFLPLAAILAGVAGFLLFRSLSRRLEHLEDRVRRVASGDLEVRVMQGGRDEIGRLGAAFNSMAARLQQSRERLLEVDQQRRRFLADVTHDLATPLTTIRGYAETLLDPKVPKSPQEVERYLRFIQEEALRMDALVTDLLDLARVESGTLPLQQEPTDLIALAHDVAERMRPSFAEDGSTIAVPEAGERSIVATVDRRRIDQLLANLLGNALRHLPEGGQAMVRFESEGDRKILLIVEDNGPGFGKEDLPHLFERFYRGDPSRRTGGTGLGLAIVRGIARAHGGEARAENSPEGGARIVVSLPREPVDRSAVPNGAASSVDVDVGAADHPGDG
jgi:signal transduction histidine kinase